MQNLLFEPLNILPVFVIHAIHAIHRIASLPNQVIQAIHLATVPVIAATLTFIIPPVLKLNYPLFVPFIILPVTPASHHVATVGKPLFKTPNFNVISFIIQAWSISMTIC